MEQKFADVHRYPAPLMKENPSLTFVNTLMYMYFAYVLARVPSNI